MSKILDPALLPTREEFDLLNLRDPQAAAAKLNASRESARRSYACFLKYWIFATRAPFHWNWHWAFLADIMQAVADRDPEVRFLIVNIPPRFAKSTLLSQMWQAWMIGREDSRRSALFSMTTSSTLAARDSRKTLDVIQSPWYKRLFPDVTTSNGKVTELEWETDGGAYRLACGAGGTVIGRGADHLLWDDLIKADEANSEGVREKINEWLGETLRSRLDDQKTGTITGIMQRLHERDPTGFLLDRMRIKGADQYKLISLPNEAPSRTIVSFKNVVYAVREQGTLLHHDRIGPDEAAALRVSLHHNYSGQYQQNPVKMEGGQLDPRRIVRLPGNAMDIKSMYGLTPTIILDFASTEKQTQKDDPDFNVIGVGARDQLGRLILLDMWRKQTADQEFIARTLLNMCKLWQPSLVRGEKGGLINTFQPSLLRVSRMMGVYCALLPLKGRTLDKVARSMPLQGMLNAGMVCAPQGAQWFDAFAAELRAFPNGGHDDQVDVASDFAAIFDDLRKGEAPVIPSTCPETLADEDYKARIAKAIERERRGGEAEDDWSW